MVDFNRKFLRYELHRLEIMLVGLTKKHKISDEELKKLHDEAYEILRQHLPDDTVEKIKEDYEKDVQDLIDNMIAPKQ